MNREVDCLIIGYNEMKFENYHKMVHTMGTQSEAYKDLQFSFVRYNDKLFTITDLYNLIKSDDQKELALTDTFSATIAYLGTFLHRREISFDYIKSFQLEKEKLIELLTTYKIHTIAIPTTLYISHYPIEEIIKFIKKYNDKAKIIIGGPYITTNYRALDPMTFQFLLSMINADFYVNDSQGEDALYKLVKYVKQPDKFNINDINNIYYKQNNKFTSTERQPEKNKLSDNIVDWSLFKKDLDNTVMVRSAISCPFSCAFCGFPQHAGKYQVLGVDLLEKELSQLDEYGVKSLYILDDTFNVPKERFIAILKMMIRNKFKFKWHSFYRCQFADEETVQLMKESGCEGVFLGIESGNQGILQNMNKSAKVEDYINGMQLLKKYNIITFASFIMGFPGETYQSAMDSYRFIEETAPDFYRIQLWYCETITPIWNDREKYGIEGSQFKWSHKTMNSMEASNLIDECFMKIKNSVYLPQYNFDFDNIIHLLYRGYKLDEVKAYVQSFNDAVKTNKEANEDLNLNDMQLAEIQKNLIGGMTK